MGRSSLKNSIVKNLSNLPGWTTNRKIVVIESDDWGSIRMPSKKVFDDLVSIGLDLTSDEGTRYNKYDCLANTEDLAALFEVLSTAKDSTGRDAVFTPMALMVNPDFEKIRQYDFTEYFYEPFPETLKRYYGSDNPFALWQVGIQKRLFVPQFHGREHLNVKVWMRALISGHKRTIQAFDKGMWGISTANDPDIGTEFQAAFDFIEPDDLHYQKEVITSGLRLFEELFGYRATYFVPPNGPFGSKLEHVCSSEGIKYLSTSKLQVEPLGLEKRRKRLHWLGQNSRDNMIYMTRNCFFEPSQPGTDWINSCLYDISTAFRWRKPAIICSHRVNYIGALYPSNRQNGLLQLRSLLKEIVRRWPDVEFITSAELGDIIRNE